MKTIRINCRLIIAAAIPLAALTLTSNHARAQNFIDLEKIPLDRRILPVAEPIQPTISTLDARDVNTPPPLFKVTAPAKAPNIVIIMLGGFKILRNNC